MSRNSDKTDSKKRRSTRASNSDSDVKSTKSTRSPEERKVTSSRRDATNREITQASRVRRLEEIRVKNREQNRKRVRAGEKTKLDPGLEHKPSIWEKMAERRLYAQLREIGDEYKNIDKFQRKRVMIALFMVVLGVLAGMYIHIWLYLAGPIIGFIVYKMELKKVDGFYRAWKFQRQLNFSKFTRLVIPYMKASGGNAVLYTIFNKILRRTEDPADRRNLYRLMGEMGDNPSSLKPFTDYANRASGTDMSHLFMSTMFDFQQSTFDVTVIDELGKLASDDMMESIDEIIQIKVRRFAMFPTKVVMTSFILVIGLGAALMLNNMQDIGFNADAFDVGAASEQVDSDKPEAETEGPESDITEDVDLDEDYEVNPDQEDDLESND